MEILDKIFTLGFDRNQTPIDKVELQADNTVPPWLNGSFIRNGPGLFYIGDNRFNHWFDGLAMLHKFEFDSGKVNYQSKFLDCFSAREALKNDQLTYSEFATDPCWSLFGRLRSMYTHGPTDSAKVNIEKIGEQYFALGETTMQLEFDLESLNTVGKYNFNQAKFGTSSTAHPHILDSKVYNLITKYGPLNSYQIRQMDETATKVASVNTLSPSYMHSFGMSQKYFVIAESPFTVQSIKLMMVNRPFIENFSWNKNRGTRIWIIDQSTRKVVLKKEIEPFFFFHFVNCFDTEAGLCFDLVTYPDAGIIESYYLNHIYDTDKKIPGGNLTRFEVDLSSAAVTSHILSDARIEMPQIDCQRFYRRADYNYVYATGLRNSSSLFYDEIVKINIKNRTYKSWHQKNCYPGEPVFVPYPDSKTEDEGVLLTLVIDALNECSYLLILDASNLTEITRIYAPEPILAGFHGNFFKNN